MHKFQEGDSVKCSSKCPKDFRFEGTKKISVIKNFPSPFPYWVKGQDYKANELTLVKKVKTKKA